MKRARKASRLQGNLLNGLLLLFVALLLVAAIFLVRTKLLQNAQDLGMALVHSYAVEEEMNISSLETSLNLTSHSIDEVLEQGGDSAAIQNWVKEYLTKITATIGEDLVDLYAVIDGEILAVNPWDGDTIYPYQQTDWYQRAVQAGGTAVRGEAYLDAITGEKVFTISKGLAREGDVLAMDVHIQNKSMHNTAQALPDNCSYFLLDASGQLIYSSTKWDIQPSTLQSYIDYVRVGIEDGSLLAYDAFVQDLEGVSRGVYYQTMRNGWTVILTIPTMHILMGDQNTLIYILAVVALVLFLMLAYITIREALRSRSMKKADDTAHMLGDSFYAIYRVYLRDGSYEGIKIYEDLQGKVPKKGSYGQLIETMRTLVKPSTYRAFEESFSLENIQKRIRQGVEDYGGNYQRLFGDKYRWVNIRTLYDQEVDPNVVILCFRNVDEEKRREMQTILLLQDALEAAQRSTKAKSEFFSGMSHDMRTPLNAIIGCCDLAQKSREAGNAAKAEEYLKKIYFAANQLLELINDILEMSKMEAGKQNLDLREINLEEILQKTADLFRDKILEDGKTLEVLLDIRDARVLGDERKLIQILNNLLSNAVKYSNKGASIRLMARQFAVQPHSKYQIVVEDTGIGMSPEFLERLFDPYSRETTFTARATVGTGLGMSIVKSLVQQLNGEISVDSKLGEGSRFTVTIPMEPVERHSQATASTLSEGLGTVFDWSKRTVLVAEDNEINLEIASALIEQLGAHVLTAKNGQEAVQAFEASAPFAIDAILMDMRMPVMDGCQAASAIRALNRTDASTVPIVAATANVLAEDIAQTTQAGMNDHISKPIQAALLQKTLQALIAQRDEQK